MAVNLRNNPGLPGLAYQLLAVGYGFLAALSVMLLEPLSAGVFYLSLQCIMLLFVVPAYHCRRPQAAALLSRILLQYRRFLFPLGITAAGAAAAALASLVNPLGLGRILLATVFALSFGLFLAGLCSALRAFLGSSLSQALTLLVGLAMASTPYYVNSFIRATSGELRMKVVQLAVDMNPLLAGAAGIFNFDWLRSRHLYQTCLIGGYQYPFRYPSALKMGIILAAVGIVLLGASAWRRASEEQAENSADN
jgi:hypothetical protein